MQSIRKRTVSVLLAVLIAMTAVSFTTITAHADDLVIDVETEEEFAAALNMDTPVAAINVVTSFSVRSDCTVKFDPEHIENYKDVVVTVCEGVTLTVADGGSIGTLWYTYEGDWETPPVPNGSMINNGTVIVDDGGWIDAAFKENNGTMIIKDGAIAMCCDENNGTVIVEGGMYLTSQGSRSVNNGTLKIGENGVMISRFGTPIINADDGVIELDGEFMCGVLGFDDGVLLFENHGTVTGHGSVTLDNMSPEDVPAPDMDVMAERMMEQLGQETRFEDWEDIDIFIQYEVTSYEDITSHLKDRTVAGEHVEGNMDLKFFIMGDIVIPEGDSIRVMSLFVVAEGASLTVNGGAQLECGLINRSRTEVMPGGVLATTMGGNISNERDLIVHEGATIVSQMGGAVVNGESGKFILDGDFYCGCIGGESGDGCWFENFGDASGKGTVILYEAAPDIMPINDMDQLAVYVAEKFGDAENVPNITAGEFHGLDDRIPGDLNEDGDVNNKDVVVLFRYVSGSNRLEDETFYDYNEDGAVDNKDVVSLFRYVSSVKQ
ncbi:MAG: dockerin type I repeat-containing protein [Clostridia bacterium]|nr:dockerin type I repeat-containing protein [Clostridia bacterium]